MKLGDQVAVLGVTLGNPLDRGTLALPAGFHELVRDLPKRVRGRKVVAAHPQIPSC